MSDLQLPGQQGTSDLSEHHDESSGLDSYINVIEKKKIIEALDKSRWNKTAAAKILGISFRALRYRLEKLGIE